MNNRHLPAGQAMQGSGGPGSEVVPGSSGPRGGHRPRYNSQPYVPQHPVMYPGGYAMGSPHHYYQPYLGQHMNPYGQPTAMHQQYMPYPPHQHHHQAQYARSPPAHSISPQQQQQQQQQQPLQQQQQQTQTQQHYAPIVTSGMGQLPYNRPAQPSPAFHTAYQPPPPPSTAVAPYLSRTPSSTTSAHAVAPPPAPHAQPTEPDAKGAHLKSSSPPSAPSQPEDAPAQSIPESPVETERTDRSRDLNANIVEGMFLPAFTPPVPWFSHPDEPFPKRSKRKRRREPVQQETSLRITASTPKVEEPADPPPKVKDIPDKPANQEPTSKGYSKEKIPDPRPDTPSTSENAPSTSRTSPGSVQAAPQPVASVAATIKPVAPVPRLPAIPAVPLVPKKQSAPQKPLPAPERQPSPTSSPGTKPAVAQATPEKPVSAAPPKPKTWSGLFATTPAKTPGANGAAVASRAVKDTSSNGSSQGSGIGTLKAGPITLAEALRLYKVGSSEQVSFVEPRGLINTGNMCYMNSVLQVLLFCNPFHDFLHKVYKKAAHSFKCEAPLIDAMLMFVDDFQVITSAGSADVLRQRLRPETLEKFGEPFTPEFVYEAIKKLPRFASMRRGHQQDAEEFLGFLLQSLHDECINAMRTAAGGSSDSTSTTSSPISTNAGSDANGWMEVGYRQKPTVTRSSGHPQIPSPITKIFGGQLRSELRVPGLKDSVTLEPYQPLQLDITANSVRNIVDALRGLTNPEALQGDFKSPRGKTVSATKQVFIESLPPVLILHLKRFQFDAEGHCTVKVWKKVGYPLELEIPKEVIARAKRNTLSGGPPRYKLSAVVYHHGNNASGGHYTVDVRRQDGSEWIRIDDTVIRRIRSEDVAEGGAEDSKPSSGRGNSCKDGIVSGTSNRFNGIGEDESGDEDGWKHVPPAANGKKWSSVVNGAPAAPPVKKPTKDNVKDNKVAYLLFYQRI